MLLTTCTMEKPISKKTKLRANIVIIVQTKHNMMKTLKKLLVLELVVFGIILMSSCKTKQAVAEDNKFEEALDERSQENQQLLGEAGLEMKAAEALSEQIKEMDKDFMNFLETDPDNEAKSAKLRAMMAAREAKIKASMTPEQYEAYRKALLEKTKKKSETEGGPYKGPNG